MREVGKILYGSQNYGLDGPDSDRDYKILMMPTFEDFYNYHKVDKGGLPEKYKHDHEHNTVMNILTFDRNLRKGNFNAIELLYSREQVYEPRFEEYFKLAQEAYSWGYLFIVWEYFISTIEGLIKNTLHRCEVDRKTASRVVYFINFCKYVAQHDFEIGTYSWKANKEARELRFNESISIPTKEELLHQFEEMKISVIEDKRYHAAMYSQTELELIALRNNIIADCMKNIIKQFLRDEL